MSAVVEPVFDVAYLLSVVILGGVILRRSRGERVFVLFGAAAILLGAGDAFHLVPRVAALLTDGIENHPAALGVGKLVTSLTMTAFYVLLYEVWRARYAAGSRRLTAVVYGLAVLRAGLCLLPQNRWLDPESPFAWGVYRNLPFVALGGLLIALFARRRGDRPFRFMPLALFLSFAFYVPVVLGAGAFPLLGMLMLPKTLAYLWVVLMGVRAAERDKRGGAAPTPAPMRTPPG